MDGAKQGEAADERAWQLSGSLFVFLAKGTWTWQSLRLEGGGGCRFAGSRNTGSGVVFS